LQDTIIILQCKFSCTSNSTNPGISLYTKFFLPPLLPVLPIELGALYNLPWLQRRHWTLSSSLLPSLFRFSGKAGFLSLHMQYFSAWCLSNRKKISKRKKKTKISRCKIKLTRRFWLSLYKVDFRKTPGFWCTRNPCWLWCISNQHWWMLDDFPLMLTELFRFSWNKFPPKVLITIKLECFMRPYYRNRLLPLLKTVGTHKMIKIRRCDNTWPLRDTTRCLSPKLNPFAVISSSSN